MQYQPLTQKSYTVRIVVPLSPGCFEAQYQTVIQEACDELSIEITNVTSVGMIGSIPQILNVRENLNRIPSERPVRPNTPINMAELEDLKDAEMSWEAMKRLERELNRREINVQTYTEKR